MTTPSATRRAIVVYNSLYGNTRAAARAVAEGLRTGMHVELVEARGGLNLDLRPIDLLVVGGPTHRRGLSERLRMFLDELEPAQPAGPQVAVFDTRYRGLRLRTGSAAGGAARRLRRRGYLIEEPPQSYSIDPLPRKRGSAPRYLDEVLEPGELDRARDWGLWLMHQTKARGPSSIASPTGAFVTLVSKANHS